jgi:conjugal transfer ATP-binding protein TraC
MAIKLKELWQRFFDLDKKFKDHDQWSLNYQHFSSFYKICDLLPYDSFDEKTKIFHNPFALGFVVESSLMVGACEMMQKEISNIFNLMLPVGSSLQVTLWADPKINNILDFYVQARKQDNFQILAQKRSDYLQSLVYSSPMKPYSLRNFRCFLSFSIPKSKSIRFDVENLQKLQSQILTSLEMLNLKAFIWDCEDLLNTLEGIINIKKSKGSFCDRLRWNRLENLSSQLSCSESFLQVTDDNLVLNDFLVKTYGVRQFPKIWSLNAMGDLIGSQERDQAQIPCPFLMTYGIYLPLQEQMHNKLKVKKSYVDKQLYSPIGKYLTNLGEQAEELDFVKSALDKGEKIVQTSFNVTLLADAKELAYCEQTLINLFTSLEWKLESNRFLHLPCFLSNLPLLWGHEQVKTFLDLKKLKTTLSTESANLLPMQAEWQGTQTPAMILAGRRGQIFHWSPFDNNTGNYNVCVVGRSGSGKSVFMQELLASTMGLGGRVFVLDVGRSFEKTCLLLEGQFIEFSPHNAICLNPFSSLPADNDEVASDALAMIKNVLILMASPSQSLDDKKIALLEQAMLETWNLYKNDANITLIAQWLNQRQDKQANDLSQMLFTYTQNGTYGRFFNGKASVNLESPLVVIELEELKERKDLQSVIVQMMVINITNQMFLGDRNTPFHIVFDEAWDMLRGKTAQVFIETLARRLRKYKGSLVVGTQSINDFFANPSSQAAFDNSDWLCLLSQKTESIEQLKKSSRLSLSPQKENLLKSLKTKQGFYAETMITSSNGYAIGRLLLDPFTKLLYSTTPQDYSLIQSLKAQGFSLSEAIEKVIEQS